MVNFYSNKFFNTILIFFIIIFILLINSCSKESDKTLLADFDGGKFTIDQFIAHYNKLSPEKKEEKLTSAIIKEIVAKKTMEKIVIAESYANGLDKDSMFTRLNEKALERMYYQNYVRTQVADGIISDSLVNKFYREYSPQFSMKYIMRPFLTSSEADFIASQNEKINEAYSLLKSGTKFENVVNEFSQDRVSKEKGGSLGWTIREAFGDPVLRKVMDKLSHFEYSKPFKGYNGFYILYKGDKREVKVPPFKDVSNQIQATLKHTRQYLINAEIDKIFSIANKKYNYKINEEIIQDLIDLDKNGFGKSREFPLKYGKLSNSQKSIVVASFKGRKITLEEIFKRKNQSPTNKSEFYERLNAVSRNFLIAKYAKDDSKQRELKLDSDSSKIKEALLLQIYHYEYVKKKVEILISSQTELTDQEISRKKIEYEKEVFKEVEEELKEKYNLKFKESNFNGLIEIVNKL